MVRIYHKEQFNIYSYGREYIIHNTHKPFHEGHTHVNNYKTAKMLIDLCIWKQFPYHRYERFIESLSRITDDKIYYDELIEELNKIRERKNKRI